MHQTEYLIISAGDRKLLEKVERLISEKRAYIIRADQSFRHTKRLIRMIRFIFESKKEVNVFTATLDAYYSGDILCCRGIAVTDNNYNWRYELTPEGVDLIFDPPT